ncbi:MAG: class I SAM-dependent methyltransferase [Gemmataceae bacterium]
MPLVDLPPFPSSTTLPATVHRFLRDADRRIERFRWDRHFPAFVPSDFALAYGSLAALESSGILEGRWFCEWGSGFGVMTCLASMLEFDAWGIEIEGELVEAARGLAEDYGLPAVFVRGSFIPAGGQVFVKAAGQCAWLAAIAGGDHELGLDPDDFDVIFAYPWPDEERLTEQLFERYARAGAILMTYHEVGGLRLRQKRNKAG